MTSFCCLFKRHSSPDTSPVRVTIHQPTRSRFPLSTSSPTETLASASEAVAASVHKIFEEVASDEAQGGSFQANESTKHKSKLGLQSNETLKNIHGIAKRATKTLSRDSGILKTRPKRTLRSSISHEDTSRSYESKRSSHGKAKSKFDENEIEDDGEYDEDAVPIKTPRSTWGKEPFLSMESNPRGLSGALKPSYSPLCASQSDRDPRKVSNQAFAPRRTTSTLSPLLMARGSSIAASLHDQEDQNIDMEVDNSEPMFCRPTQKYISRDESKSPKKPSTRTPSPLERSDTVIRIHSSSAVVELGRPTFLNTLGNRAVPGSPHIQPNRTTSISDSVAGRELRFSYAANHRSSGRLQFPTTLASENLNDAIEDYGRSIRTTPESWTRGALGLFRGSINRKKEEIDRSQHRHPQSEHGNHCNPADEERGFGGVDGGDANSTVDEFLHMPGPCARKQSSGSDSVHLYNMRIPQRLASQGLLHSVSQPYLQEFATLGEQIVTDEYTFMDSKPRRRVSSSGFHSGKVPLAWGLPKRYASSSVYSQEPPKKYTASSVYSHDTPYITPADSHQSSIMFLNKIADQMNRFGPDAPAHDIISVPAAKNKHADLTQLERRTGDTSFHSSNESLTNRELAAAEIRIQPRAKTWKEPKSSWFKEDFDDVAAAIKKTNPHRRTVSEKLNRQPSLSSYDGSTEHRVSIQPRGDRFSFVTGDHNDIGTSVWEKALREHEEEDLAIARTRAGSDLMLSKGNSFRLEHRQHIDLNRSTYHRRFIDRVSPEHKQGDILQAKLGAYRLPNPMRKRTLTDELQSSVTPRSPSSWLRYSSHDREQCSPASAGEVDNVFARDFAEEVLSASRLASQRTGDVDPTATVSSEEVFPSKRGNRQSKSMSLGRNAMAKLQKIYRAGSLEFASRSAFGSHGHRSSISVGRAVAYPELEMLPPLSPPLSAFINETSRLEQVETRSFLEPVTSLNNAGLIDLDKFGTAKAAQRVSGTPGARTWSRMYVENCVSYPTNSPTQASVLQNVVVGEDIKDLRISELGVEETLSVDKDESEVEVKLSGEADGNEKAEEHRNSSESAGASFSDDVR